MAEQVNRKPVLLSIAQSACDLSMVDILSNNVTPRLEVVMEKYRQHRADFAFADTMMERLMANHTGQTCLSCFCAKPFVRQASSQCPPSLYIYRHPEQHPYFHCAMLQRYNCDCDEFLPDAFTDLAPGISAMSDARRELFESYRSPYLNLYYLIKNRYHTLSNQIEPLWRVNGAREEFSFLRTYPLEWGGPCSAVPFLELAPFMSPGTVFYRFSTHRTTMDKCMFISFYPNFMEPIIAFLKFLWHCFFVDYEVYEGNDVPVGSYETAKYIFDAQDRSPVPMSEWDNEDIFKILGASFQLDLSYHADYHSFFDPIHPLFGKLDSTHYFRDIAEQLFLEPYNFVLEYHHLKFMEKVKVCLIYNQIDTEETLWDEPVEEFLILQEEHDVIQPLSVTIEEQVYICDGITIAQPVICKDEQTTTSEPPQWMWDAPFKTEMGWLRDHLPQIVVKHEHKLPDLTQVREVVSGLIPNISVVEKVISTLTLIYLYQRTPQDWGDTIALVTSLMCGVWGIASKVVSKVSTKMQDAFTKVKQYIDTRFETEGENSWLESLTYLISTPLCLASKIPELSYKQIKECLVFTGLTGRAMSTIKDVWSIITSIISTVVKYIRSLLGCPQDVGELKDMVDGIQEWADKVGDMSKTRIMEKIAVKPETCALVRKLYGQAVDYNRRFMQTKVPFTVTVPFYKLKMLVDKWMEAVEKSSADVVHTRPEPAMVLFYGKPGVGKSGILNLLSAELVGRYTNVDDWSREVYFRSIQQEFWDGYTGQFVCVYDDFMQITDSPQTPNEEIMEVIRVNNICKYPLHMADLSKKETTAFTSKVVLLSSNRLGQPKSITCNEAYRRRRDYVFEVTVHEDYATETGALDVEKARNRSGVLNPDVYVFTEIDPVTEQTTGNNLTYSQMRTRVMDKLDAKVKVHDEVLHFLQDKMMKFRTETGEEDPETSVDSPDCEGHYFGDQKTDWMSNYIKWIYDVCGSKCWLQCLTKVCGDGTPTPVMIKQAYEEAENYHQFFIKMSDWELDHIKKVINDLNKPDIGTDTDQVTKLKTNFGKYYEVASDKIKELISKYPLLILGSLCGLLGAFLYKRYGTQVREKVSSACGYVRSFFMRKRAPTAEEMEEVTPCVEDCDVCTAVKPTYPVEKGTLGSIIREKLHSFISQTGMNGKVLVQTIAHEDLPPEGKHPHLHECVKCSEIFEHTHAKPAIGRSRRHIMMCANCKETHIEGFVSGDNRTDRTPRRPIVTRGKMQTETCVDRNALDIINGAVQRNTVRLEALREDGSTIYVHGVFVKGLIVMVPAHFAQYLEECEELSVCMPTFVQKVAISDIKIHYFDNKARKNQVDGAFLALPQKLFNQHEDITKHFVEEKDLVKTQDGYLLLCRFTREGTWFLSSSAYDSHEREGDEDVIEYLEGRREYGLRYTYSYDIPTEGGDCGALIVAQCPQLPRKILGFHIGSKANIGLAMPVTYEDLKHELSSSAFKIEQGISLNLEQPKYAKEQLVEEMPDVLEGFVPLCLTSSMYTSASKSAIRPSLIFEEVKEATTYPAVLKPKVVDGEVRDPLILGLKKCTGPVIDVDEEVLETATNAVSQKICKNRRKAHLRVLDYEESIVGVPTDEFMLPINRLTSSGYVWMHQTTKPGKTEWLGSEENYDFEHPVLREAVEERLWKAQQGERVLTVWVDTLKDERRTIQKIYDCKTRVFSAGQMDYLLAMRMYFLPFVAHCMHNNIRNEIAVGINPYGNDWSLLHDYLMEVGDNVMAGDFSNYDGTLVKAVLLKVFDVIMEFYNHEEETIRRVLYTEIVESVHVCRDVIYQWTHSLPSGNMMTVILNCIYQMITLRIVWIWIMQQALKRGECSGEMVTMSAFEKHVRAIFYGDDNVISVSKKVSDLFNQKTVTEAYVRLGMTYTDEQKTGSVNTMRRLEEVSFLKRRWRYVEELRHYVAPRELDSVLETLNWIRGQQNTRLLTRTNCETVTMELSLHEKDTFDRWAGSIRNVAYKYNLGAVFLRYKEYRYVNLSKYLLGT